MLGFSQQFNVKTLTLLYVLLRSTKFCSKLGLILIDASLKCNYLSKLRVFYEIDL
jgi:hypothetical protein